VAGTVTTALVPPLPRPCFRWRCSRRGRRPPLLFTITTRKSSNSARGMSLRQCSLPKRPVARWSILGGVPHDVPSQAIHRSSVSGYRTANRDPMRVITPPLCLQTDSLTIIQRSVHPAPSPPNLRNRPNSNHFPGKCGRSFSFSRQIASNKSVSSTATCLASTVQGRV
jgi:hypothetical protein